MAYLMLDADRILDRPATATAPAPAALSVDDGEPAARLTGLEWSVVALARKDALSSLRRPGRMASALGALFRQPHNPMLADERLEALRRIAVFAWHYGYTIPSTELARFLDAGFSPAQYELMTDSIGVARRKTMGARR
ncbi:hypothetical protein ACLBWH_00950 [Sphingomonas sp. M6A6_1c]